MGVASQHCRCLLTTAALSNQGSLLPHTAMLLFILALLLRLLLLWQVSLASSCWDVCVSFEIIQMEKDTRTQRPGYKQGSRDWGPGLYNVHSL